MQLIATKNFYYKTDEMGSQKTTKGEPFSIDLGNEKNRQNVLMLMQNGFAYPGDWPEVVEIKITRAYNVRVPQVEGLFSGNAGETRDVPRLVALYLVTHQHAKPERGVWNFDLHSEDEIKNMKVKKLFVEAEEKEADKIEKRANNWVSRFRRK